MAKPASQMIMLVNEEVPDSPTKYIRKVSTKGPKAAEKLRLRKYDPHVRRHCVFIQKRLPNPKA